MSCNSPSARLVALEAELARERARRERAEAALHQQALVVATLCGGASSTANTVVAEPPVAAPAEVPSEAEDEARAERRRAQAAARKRTQRERARAEQQRGQDSVTGVTAGRDSVTPSVTVDGWMDHVDPTSQSPSRSKSRGRDRGALATVHVTAGHDAREAPRAPPAEERLPPEVEALRAAWQQLAVPHGFAPWPARTPKRLVEDALRALERHPLEDWRTVFSRVPRSPVCRGELPNQRWRMDLVRLLVGAKGRDGYEPAESLLLERWSVDPEPQPEAPARVPTPTGEAPAQPVAGDTPDALAWGTVLAALRADRRDYAVGLLAQLRPCALEDGVLVLEARDRFAAEWVAEHYGELLRGYTERAGLVGVRYQLPGGGAP